MVVYDGEGGRAPAVSVVPSVKVVVDGLYAAFKRAVAVDGQLPDGFVKRFYFCRRQGN